MAAVVAAGLVERTATGELTAPQAVQVLSGPLREREVAEAVQVVLVAIA